MLRKFVAWWFRNDILITKYQHNYLKTKQQDLIDLEKLIREEQDLSLKSCTMYVRLPRNQFRTYQDYKACYDAKYASQGFATIRPGGIDNYRC